MVDPHFLHECFAATLSADQSIRSQAEAQLRQAERSLGFLGACLDILSSGEVQPGVKTAAAVFFKNRVVRHWEHYGGQEKDGQVDNDEKPLIRDRLLPTIVQSDPHLRKQFVPVLHQIIKFDYPAQWPDLLDKATQLLYTGDLNAAYTGLLCYAQVCSSYRWLSNEERAGLDTIIEERFPTLLQVAETLLNEESQAAGEMTVLVLKSYKYITYRDLPQPLQTEENMTNWGKIHVQVIQKALPQYVMNLDESERRLHPWVKAKKWAYANLYRLFSRYASESLSKRFEYTAFKQFFNENFIPQLLQLYLSQVDQWCSRQLWISDECLFHLISFLENCVTQKATWQMVKPHFELLVSHFIFPLLCPSDATLEQFEDEPEDYIHTKLDIYDNNNAPDLAAISLLMTLTGKKKKTTLDPITQFTLSILNQYTNATSLSLEDAKKLEGGMRLLGSLFGSYANPKSPYYNQMEQCLSKLIIPHFESPYAFIKARACEVAAKFSDIPINNDSTIAVLYQGVIGGFGDEHLPVQLEAALALQSFIKIPQFTEAVSSIVVPTMQKLLTLSNTLDAEAISAVMQELVEVYAEQLQPFGVELMANLVQQFMRMATELNNTANAEADDLNGEVEDMTDKQMAALGLLNTMITILLSFESSAEIVLKLEEVYAPAVEFVFKNDMEDFFREAGELIENSSFLIRRISPVTWNLFELIIASMSRNAAIFYIEDLMPAMNNYLVYGSDDVKSNPRYAQAFLSLFELLMESEDSTADESIQGGEIGQKLILALGDSAAPILEKMLAIVINDIVNANDLSTAYTIAMLDVVVAGLVYHAKITLTTLAKGNFTLPFFNMWSQLIPKMTRVYDLKLSTLGLLSLVNLSGEDMQTLQIYTLANKFGSMLAQLMERLPTAMNQLEKKRKEFEVSAVDPGAEGYGEWPEEYEEDDEENDAAGDDYLEFLNNEAAKLKAEWDNDDGESFEEELEEDPLANTILDNVNVFATFKEVVTACQTADAQKYGYVFGEMTGEEQETLKNVLEL